MDDVIKFFLGAGGVAIIGGLFTALNAHLQRKEERRKAKEKAEQEAKEKEYVFSQKAFDGIVTSVGELKEAVAVTQEAIAATQSSIKNIYYDRLSQKVSFFTDRGWCSRDEKQVLKILWEEYKAAGHNHITESQVERVFALPDKPPKN